MIILTCLHNLLRSYVDITQMAVFPLKYHVVSFGLRVVRGKRLK